MPLKPHELATRIRNGLHKSLSEHSNISLRTGYKEARSNGIALTRKDSALTLKLVYPSGGIKGNPIRHKAIADNLKILMRQLMKEHLEGQPHLRFTHDLYDKTKMTSANREVIFTFKISEKPSKKTQAKKKK